MLKSIQVNQKFYHFFYKKLVFNNQYIFKINLCNSHLIVRTLSTNKNTSKHRHNNNKSSILTKPIYQSRYKAALMANKRVPFKLFTLKLLKKVNLKALWQACMLAQLSFGYKKHKLHTRKKKNRLRLLLKKNKLEQSLTFLAKQKVELKLTDLLQSKKSSTKFRKSYRSACKKLKRSQEFKFYKQLKETISVIALGLFFSNSTLVANLFARTINMSPFKFLKHTLKSFISILTIVHSAVTPYNSIRINISGKFKGKARRSNMIYFKKGRRFSYNTMDSNQMSYIVDYIQTSAGIFGLKIWCN